MTIVCGTDFSERARQAGRAAAAIAARFDERLVLVHVADELGAELSDGGPEQPLCGTLRQEATELRAIAPRVDEALASGAVDVALAEAARRYEARLLVVSSLGRRAPARWLLGGVAERAAQAAPVPVLVARGGGAFEAWARGERPLRVLVGVDGSPAARAALDWVGELRRAGACDVTAGYVASPPEEHARLGVPGPMPLDRFRPEIEDVLRRDVAGFVGDLPGEGDLSIAVRPGPGRVDHHLATLAEDLRADLLVVGTHHRRGGARIWPGSVSRGAMRLAAAGVACVPVASASPAEPARVPRLARVLAATDLSAWSNRAVGYAYALAADGGAVHLLHVRVPDLGAEPGDEQARCEAALRALVPPDAAGRRLTTTVEVAEALEPAEAILAAAERVGADALCVATRARQGFARVAFGSVAQRVLSSGRRPVFLVPPPPERAWTP